MKKLLYIVGGIVVLVIAAALIAPFFIDLNDYKAITLTSLETLLVPQYIERVTDRDGWKNPYQYYLDPTNVQSQHIMVIGSGGRDASRKSPKIVISVGR